MAWNLDSSIFPTEKQIPIPLWGGLITRKELIKMDGTTMLVLGIIMCVVWALIGWSNRAKGDEEEDGSEKSNWK